MSLLDRFRRKKLPAPSSSAWERTPSPKPTTYRDADGRRRRTDAPYLLPKDEQEMQRLDYQHFLFRHVLQGNTFAPVDDLLKRGGNVLDVGCGTGRWGCEMALTYPKTQVVGLDLENVPRTASMPLNYHFQRGNLLDGLPFASKQFDYVHQRLLVAGIPSALWPSVIRDLKRVIHPGGYLELVEMGTTFHHAGPATTQFLDWWAAISASRGIDASKLSGIGTLLHGSGCSQVQTKTEVLPVGSWGGRIGNLLAQDMLAGWPTMRPSAHALLHVSPDDFNAVMGRLETEWNTLQTSYEVYFACGQC